MKPHDDVMKYIEQIAIVIFESMFTKEEREGIFHLLCRYGFMSWPPNLPPDSCNIDFTPLLYKVMLQTPDLPMNPYENPAVANPTTDKNIYSNNYSNE